MARFFIDRPIFAWVVAIVIMLAGVISILSLPIAQYPSIAPPSISISGSYPGASAKTVEDAVTQVIEQKMKGIDGLRYMASSSDATGGISITLTFSSGTNPDIAQVQVQNKLQLATPLLPTAVTQQGLVVSKATKNFLMVFGFISENGKMDQTDLSDYVAANVVDPLSRVPGVGDVTLFGSQYAMRIWLDPAKLQSFNLTPADVITAVQAQNAEVSAGELGGTPSVKGQQLNATVSAQSRLQTVEQFGAILLKTTTEGAMVHLKDVASMELGRENYNTVARYNGHAATGVAIKLATGANALDTANAAKAMLGNLSKQFPEGMSYQVAFDTTPFVKLSIEEVVKTLVEAVILVFLVMYLFLQNFRATLIPTMAVPVVLLGTFGILNAFGYSINTLTMFAMVLAIGLLVDDAIVVVENVERIMTEEGLPPLEATRKAMGQISGAIIGVTVVLMSVFVPLAFFAGAVGNIYRQFSAVMVSSIFFSAFMALSLTPALCAHFLQPVEKGHAHVKKGFFGWFNRGFTRTAKRYEGWVGSILRHTGRALVAFVLVIGLVGLIFTRLPSSFLPNEDQGYIIANVQLPAGATLERTSKVMRDAEAYILKQPEVATMVSVLGFNFSGQGQNVALAFIPLKDWKERGAGHGAADVAGRITGALSSQRDSFVFALSPPPIPELGTGTGFSFRLQDRGGNGPEALLAARNQMLGMASKNPVLAGVRPEGLEAAPQVQLDIDRDKANALGVTFDAINTAISTSLGSSYINDFPNNGRLQRVVVQAEAESRMQPEDLLRLNAVNSKGQQVPLSAFATTRWITGPMQTVRYNGYSTMRISGDAAKGYSTGQALAEMEKMAAQLPAGFGFEWTGQSREEQLSGSTVFVLLGFALLAVFLALAALYESWSIPVAVLLVVPFGVLGALMAASARGLPNDVYFKVGLITIIGLGAKNAVLIIEFAKELQEQGMSAVDAAIAACHLRFRPILMTSLAFILGVLPLVIASGAGSASQRAIGTGVMGGMITATALGVFFVPVFFVLVRKLFGGKDQPHPVKPHVGGPAVVVEEKV